MNSNTATRRDWNWESDGTLDGMYVETRQVTVKNGPSAGRQKLIFDFHVGVDDEAVSVWETAVIRSKFTEELQARRKPDFEPGERVTIEPLDWKESENGRYRNFEVTFEHAAPKRSAAELLSSSEPFDEEGDFTPGGSLGPDDDLPF